MALKFLNDGYFASKVGIGTASPAAPFHVDLSDVQVKFQLNNLSSGFDGILVDGTNASYNLKGGNGDEYGLIALNDGSFRIYNPGGSGYGFTMTNTGRFGLSNTAPTQRLDVNGNIKLSNNSQLMWRNAANNADIPILQLTSSNQLNIGTTSSSVPTVVAVHTSSSEKMRITSDGKVGIGTTSPSYKLQVEGGIKVGDNAGTNLDFANAGIIIKGTAAGNNSYMIFEQQGIANWRIGNRATTGNFDILNGGSGSEKLTITTGGNVGIGTTSPSQKLTVEGNIELGTGGYVYGDTTTSYLRLNTAAGSLLGYSNGYIGLGPSFVYNVGGSEKFRIQSSTGNVGIKTTSPSNPLSINFAPNGIANITATNASTAWNTSSALMLEGSSNSNGLGFGVSGTANDRKSWIQSGHPNQIYATHLGTLALNPLGGNVGIGTTSPLYKLAVEGSVAVQDAQNLWIRGGRIGYENTALNNAAYIYNIGASGSSKLNIADSLYVVEAGNVGIGTTNPLAKLHLVSSGSDLFPLRLNSIGAKTWQIGIGGPNYYDGQFLLQDTSVGERLRINSAGTFTLPAYNSTNQTGTPTYLLGTDASGNIVKTNTIPGSGAGPYLPLAGGTMSGNLSVGAAATNGAGIHLIYNASYPEIRIQSGENGTNAFAIYNTATNPDAVQFFINNNLGSSHLGNARGALKLEDSAGVNLTLSSGNATFAGDVAAANASITTAIDVGSFVYVGGNNSIFAENNLRFKSAGPAYIDHNTVSQSIKFRLSSVSSLDIIPLEITPFYLASAVDMYFADNNKIRLGASSDLQIYHDGSNSFVADTGTGGLFVEGNSEIRLRKQGTSEIMAQFLADAEVRLYYNNVKKFETTSTGVTITGAATATTFLGDLNGTINTATTAVTKANATNDTTVATTAFVQNLIGTIPAGLVFQGTWNAATNTPTLTSGSGTTGHFYIVSTDGSTNLDGITDWVTGDWAVFVEQGATDAWEKVDNSSVLDGSGTGQTVSMWSGSGTSNTLTDAPITVSGNNTTFAGVLALPDGSASAPSIVNTGDTNTGMYWPGDHQLGFAVDGSRKFYMSTTEAFFQNLSSGVTINAGGIDVTGDSTFAGSLTATGLLTIGTTAGSNINMLRTSANYISATNNTGYLVFRTGGYDAALTLDASQNATFAGTLAVQGTGNSYFTGNVGIGTTSPDAPLTIHNSSDPEIRFGYSSTQDHKIQWDSSKVFIHADPENANGSSALGLGVDGSLGFYMDSSRNVGIGTTSPTAKLDVNGNIRISAGGAWATSNGGMQLTYDGTTGYLTTYYDSNSLVLGAGVSQKTGIYINGQSAATNDIKFKVGNSTRVTFDSSGNVGIGTTSPDSLLELENSPAAQTQSRLLHIDNNPTNNQGSGYIEISSGSNNQAKTQIEQVSSGGFGLLGNQYIDTNIINRGLSSSPHGNINFATGSSTSATSIVMTIGGGSQKGNVGIGTTDPKSKLQIDGGVQMADDTATASADKVGTLRYRTSGNNSYVDMCMQTGATTYEWVNIVQNNW